MVLAVIHLTDVSCSKVGVLRSEEVEVVCRLWVSLSFINIPTRCSVLLRSRHDGLVEWQGDKLTQKILETLLETKKVVLIQDRAGGSCPGGMEEE